MNILFLPHNIASMPAITAARLNIEDGITAIALTYDVHKYQELNSQVVILPLRRGSKMQPVKWAISRLKIATELKKWIKWADVLHYTIGPVFENGIDLKWASSLKKPIFIEWVGSDIRNPDYLKKINPFYKAVFSNGYEYAAMESKKKSFKNQQLFAKYNAQPLLCPEIQLFVDKNIFPKKVPLLFTRINAGKFIPNYPSANCTRPLIVHSPSAKIAKGSPIIIQVIDELKKDFDFDFLLLHDMTREEVLINIQKADIFIDQMIVGSYGMATMEAMSYGKPVMCYLMPQLFDKGLPRDCPIVNANPDNLKNKLTQLISNPQLRHDIGKLSRSFVETYHNVDKIALQLVEIYKAAIENNRVNA